MGHHAIRDFLRGVGGSDLAGTADAELLARFAESRDESAFELLVWRHAAMVQRVCRAVLGDYHAAEDAAQAAFLVLARKAHTFSGRGSVVGWLYQVARRIAVRLASHRARQSLNSAELDRIPEAKPDPQASPDEIAALCAEVDQLPERYRVPILLCFFEGLTHAEAARRTGWPVGTVAGRLARAKDILARRLSARGVGIATVTLAVPGGSFVGATAQAAVAFAARQAVVPGVKMSVVVLAQGALKAMTTMILKMTAATIAVALATTAGVWGYTSSGQQPQPAVATATPVAQAKPDAQPPRIADARQRAKSLNNIKLILIALHNYESANGHLPNNITDKDGKQLLSWRVAILPYIEQEPLYREFKFDESWDSENNKKLLAQMPAVYRVGIEPKDATKTYYQAFAGPGTMFEPGKKMSLAQIPDGTSNTLAVVEAGPPVEWTKPADLPYDPKKPLPKLEGPFANVLIAGAGDGAAYALKRDLDEKTLRHLIERNDGNVFPQMSTLTAKFALSGEEIKSAQEALKFNETLIEGIAEQLREQQKLLVEFGKKRNPNDPIKGLDLERLGQLQRNLLLVNEALKKETAELRKELEGKKEVPPDSKEPPKESRK
jgi:RNA polymerase sigma factor (sigma-70 family)